MINPLGGVYLNNRYYNFDASSYRMTFPLRNSVNISDNSKTFAVRGGSLISFTLTLAIDTQYNIYNGITLVGATLWTGISRLEDLRSFCGADGASMPLIFVRPDGVTNNVVPTGLLDISIFNASLASTAGCDYRVSLTLEQSS